MSPQIITGPQPPLEPVKSQPSETAQSITTVDERPIAFGPLWKEIVIVLLCTCGPMVQVPHPTFRD
jgi:hypothetical protein